LICILSALLLLIVTAFIPRTKGTSLFQETKA
jgi:hypothetical protein